MVSEDLTWEESPIVMLPFKGKILIEENQTRSGMLCRYRSQRWMLGLRPMERVTPTLYHPYELAK